jgi:hypothetical protein
MRAPVEQANPRRQHMQRKNASRTLDERASELL